MPTGFESYVEAVPGRPLPHGLLGGCIPIVDDSNMHHFLGTQHRAVSGAGTRQWEWCPPAPGQPATKAFTRSPICDARPVTVYAGTECSVVGMTFEESIALSVQTLELGGSRALEEWYMRELCQTAADLTPVAGALSVAQGVSVLENWLGVNYGGAGVIHAPAGAGAQFSRDHIADTDNCGPNADCCLRTLTGNDVVLGSGYSVNVGPPGCTVAPDGEMWLYITGPLRIRRDPEIRLPDSEAESVNTSINNRRTLVEQTYVIESGICESAAVRVKIC